jgi:AcrR family transcriptional regulator
MPTQTFFNLSEEKRALIVTASMEEFYQFGFEKASIARIVTASGIARGSFYQYFDDIKDLYRYMIVEVIGQQKHSYSNHSFTDTTPFAQMVRNLLYGGICFYRDHPMMAKISQDFLKLRDIALSNAINGDSMQKSAEYFRLQIEHRKATGEIAAEIDTEALHHFVVVLSTTISETIRGKDISAWDHHDIIGHVDKFIYILNNALGGPATK